jgi:hypothetical protein
MGQCNSQRGGYSTALWRKRVANGWGDERAANYAACGSNEDESTAPYSTVYTWALY